MLYKIQDGKMKKLFVFLFIFTLFFSCSDDEEIIFNANPSDVQITFEPIEGGAYMNYTLPNNSDIYYLQVKYKDFTGKEIILKNTYLKNKLRLFGFTEAKEKIPLEISLIDKNDNVSKSITKYFDTKISPSVGIFNGLKVKPFWDGFKINYEIEKESEAFINIGYIGINPKTKEMDTLLVVTQAISPNFKCLEYTKIKDLDVKDVDVVVWTEDFRGNDVKKVVYKNVPVARAEAIDCSNVGFEGESIESSTKHTGWKNLFDGDKKGINALKFGKGWTYCFRSGKDCIKNENHPEKSVWTIDLKEQENLAYVRIYSHSPLNVKNSWGGLESIRYRSEKQTPNHVKVYATNDPEATLEECEELGEYHQMWSIIDEYKWNWESINTKTKYTIEDIDQVEKMADIYLQVNFEASDKKYRYVKIKVLETFYDVYSSGAISDGDGKLYMEEIEIYKRKNQ